jgi:hypothetical protein
LFMSPGVYFVFFLVFLISELPLARSAHKRHTQKSVLFFARLAACDILGGGGAPRFRLAGARSPEQMHAAHGTRETGDGSRMTAVAHGPSGSGSGGPRASLGARGHPGGKSSKQLR